MKKMSKREWLKWMAASFASSVVLPSFLSSCGKGNEQTLESESGEEPGDDEPTGQASQVWMTTDLSAAGLLAVYRAVGRQATGRSRGARHLRPSRCPPASWRWATGRLKIVAA